jgi:hypothetical protein
VVSNAPRPQAALKKINVCQMRKQHDLERPMVETPAQAFSKRVFVFVPTLCWHVACAKENQT